ncbi:hypothetical protein B0H63DRAFT_445741 [Podospora didyma]|uniref:BTB domain-containing protein n=1 Tax=Podospora didyma TaxID=330526 RepID=A0AAE0U3I7_9PEZI|nr:hypothetical protein B0H63DRAFT_445741 [Podospora didyma]
MSVQNDRVSPPPTANADNGGHHADDLELDAGFEISPFSGPMISLYFSDGFPLTIHRAFMLRSSKLALLCEPSTKTLNLVHISASAGHILVQYLYTNKYRALEWRGSPFGPEASIARFKTSFEVYAAARVYELDSLEELAKEQITVLGYGLDVFAIIDVVKDAYPIPVGDDTWFPDYMKSQIKAAFENPTTLLSADFPSDFSDGTSIAKFLFRGVLEVYCEMVESLTSKTADTTTAVESDVAEPLDVEPKISVELSRDECAVSPVRKRVSFYDVACVPIPETEPEEHPFNISSPAGRLEDADDPKDNLRHLDDDNKIPVAEPVQESGDDSIYELAPEPLASKETPPKPEAPPSAQAVKTEEDEFWASMLIPSKKKKRSKKALAVMEWPEPSPEPPHDIISSTIVSGSAEKPEHSNGEWYDPSTPKKGKKTINDGFTTQPKLPTRTVSDAQTPDILHEKLQLTPADLQATTDTSSGLIQETEDHALEPTQQAQQPFDLLALINQHTPKLVSLEPGAIPKPEPVPEPESVENGDDWFGFSAIPTKVEKGLKSNSWDMVSEPDPEPEEPMQHHEPQSAEGGDWEQFKTSSKVKKGKKRKLKPVVSDPTDLIPASVYPETEAGFTAIQSWPVTVACDPEPEQTVEIEKGLETDITPDPWTFWGVPKEKRSPRSSF